MRRALIAVASLSLLFSVFVAAPAQAAAKVPYAKVTALPTVVGSGGSVYLTMKYVCVQNAGTRWSIGLGLEQPVPPGDPVGAQLTGGTDFAVCTGKEVSQTFLMSSYDPSNYTPTTAGAPTTLSVYMAPQFYNGGAGFAGTARSLSMRVTSQDGEQSGKPQANPVPPRIDVNHYVTVAKNGLSVKWPVTITCPKGRAYTLFADAADLGTGLPWDDGGDRGNIARLPQPLTGTCSGKEQTIKLVMPVIPAPDGLIYKMNRNGGPANSEVGISGSGFSTYVCAHEACPGIDIHPRPVFR